MAMPMPVRQVDFLLGYYNLLGFRILSNTLSSDIFASKKTLQYKIILHFATRNVEKLHIAATEN